MSEAAVNEPMPQELASLLDVKPPVQSKADAFTRSFLKKSLQVGQKEKTQKQEGQRTQRQTEERDEVFDIKPEHQRYELFLPLHELWKQYIIDLCNGLHPNTNPQVVQTKLLKADFHGAIIKVVRSKCASYVGLTGILIQEFKHVFKIINQKNELKVIPKRHSVFEIEVNGFVSHIYGSRIEQRASERSAKKFKSKGAIDL
ncbi:hypothetical protein WMY93_013070 [Mugilogobius chulae]|uniref:Ribonuclease P protein subunit p29 n=1 Tax=Mugilogobius chulae TaxID=88201 RepID=A0AAW0P2G0_9GOBI